MSSLIPSGVGFQPEENDMSLPPLNERALIILDAERKRLGDTYQKCAEAFGPSISPSGARALDRINDAMEAIEREIATRTGTLAPQAATERLYAVAQKQPPVQLHLERRGGTKSDRPGANNHVVD